MTKIALVTGGSRGLGKDMALSLAKKGIDVILTYHTNKTEADKVVNEIIALKQKAVALSFDVSDISSFDTFLGKISEVLNKNWSKERFDFLVNNAGVGATLPIPQVTEDAFDNLVNIHFKRSLFSHAKITSDAE
jgi:NAD(P)-dependent dehydrogenase (short-subunit alcohol dehydrogenase family)